MNKPFKIRIVPGRNSVTREFKWIVRLDSPWGPYAAVDLGAAFEILRQVSYNNQIELREKFPEWYRIQLREEVKRIGACLPSVDGSSDR